MPKSVESVFKELWNNGYAQQAGKPQVNEAMNCDIALAKADLLKLIMGALPVSYVPTCREAIKNLFSEK